MRVHILGVCGTFMGGIAMIARELGMRVTGSDDNVYPPMSTALEAVGIQIQQGYQPDTIPNDVDVVIIGNAMSRGNPAVEYVLNHNIPYISGPQWLSEQVLQKRHVLAVSGTHGKTTTSALLLWILQSAGLKPGYLVGGVMQGFERTAALGEGKYFVIEADEYDTAFYDKRSKFMHYRPQTLIINNVEFDHADIFDDLEAIQRQFQFLLRTVPSDGEVIYWHQDENIKAILARGCWSKQISFGVAGQWQAREISVSGDAFEVWHKEQQVGEVRWAMLGLHNVMNAIAAIASAHAVGVSVASACEALSGFKGIKRRMELRGTVNQVHVYDDFAHHPTAIATTLAGLRGRVGNERIIAVLQFASNTMQAGVHNEVIAEALAAADQVVLLQPKKDFNVQPILAALGEKAQSFVDTPAILSYLKQHAKPNDHILIMSNKGFDNIHAKLLELLSVVS